ncbi:MAG: bis(5'-nucleosyl)-tetraphosphatase PrpE [Sporolactobacillus sp.]
MYDIIGDVHGCFYEFQELTRSLGYQWTSGLPFHIAGRKLVFVGDIADRGPNSLQMIDTVCQLVKKGGALYVPGNHCNKLYRYFIGRAVQITHGLETTVRELTRLPDAARKKIRHDFIQLYEQAPLLLRLDKGRLIVCHAGIREDDLQRPLDKRLQSVLLYGYTTGKKDAEGRPERIDWAKDYKGNALIVYGHTPVIKPRWMNHTLNLDTGCAFGGSLSALQYPEMQTLSVPSTRPEESGHFRVFPD